MFVSFRKCSPPRKPDPISDRNCQNLYPFSDQNGSKTIPFGAAHTYIAYIGEYPPRATDLMADAEQVPQAVQLEVVQQVVNPPQAVASAVVPEVVPAVEAQQLVAGQVQDELR